MGFKINHLGSQNLSLIGLLVDLLLGVDCLLLVLLLGFDLLLLLNLLLLPDFLLGFDLLLLLILLLEIDLLLLLDLLLGIDCCLQGVRQLPGRGSRGQVLHNLLKSYSKTRGKKSECECWSGAG